MTRHDVCSQFEKVKQIDLILGKNILLMSQIWSSTWQVRRTLTEWHLTWTRLKNRRAFHLHGSDTSYRMLEDIRDCSKVISRDERIDQDTIVLDSLSTSILLDATGRSVVAVSSWEWESHFEEDEKVILIKLIKFLYFLTLIRENESIKMQSYWDLWRLQF